MKFTKTERKILFFPPSSLHHAELKPNRAYEFWAPPPPATNGMCHSMRRIRSIPLHELRSHEMIKRLKAPHSHRAMTIMPTKMRKLKWSMLRRHPLNRVSILLTQRFGDIFVANRSGECNQRESRQWQDQMVGELRARCGPIAEQLFVGSVQCGARRQWPTSTRYRTFPNHER